MSKADASLARVRAEELSRQGSLEHVGRGDALVSVSPSPRLRSRSLVRGQSMVALRGVHFTLARCSGSRGVVATGDIQAIVRLRGLLQLLVSDIYD